MHVIFTVRIVIFVCITVQQVTEGKLINHVLHNEFKTSYLSLLE